MNDRKKSPYTITEDDAYQIEDLISLLSMAVWEILRDKRNDYDWLYEAEDFSFVEQFAKEADEIIDRRI